MSEKKDWRAMGQEKYLLGKSLSWNKYTPNTEKDDHDHCAFCFKKFMVTAGNEVATEGYSTKNNSHWVCEKCFEDFKEEYKWAAS